ncbi:hypothetical protein SETIT_2G100800v2 [Setaria italica]|uniref:Zinc finger GRF-type domain-containing protein n=1 Tax=Setaria italica TaxID=4555 RepID=K3ZZQ6_SETIT|nr:hypothetical protein SETIT_2G100800v2 [Setaria italica]
MASAASGSSSQLSASSVPSAGDDGICWSPVAYQEGPLDYEPAIYCRCKKKATRWISWSILNPGRRYFACMRRWAGGCKFWKWYDDDNTSPFVWGLAKENAKLRASISEARAQIDQQLVQRETDWRTVAEKEDQVIALSDKVKKFQRYRVLLL